VISLRQMAVALGRKSRKTAYYARWLMLDYDTDTDEEERADDARRAWSNLELAAEAWERRKLLHRTLRVLRAAGDLR
jgi:hypothetical protein